jgi:hypothetical protein
MDYQNKENEIVGFVKDNFNKYNGSVKIDHYVNEFLDLDQYAYDNSVWFSFEDYSYEDLTNSSKLETCNLKVYIVVRNDKEKTLHERLRSYAGSFYNMFEDSGYSFRGIIDMGVINAVHFYDAVEGDKNKKLVEIGMALFRETI